MALTPKRFKFFSTPLILVSFSVLFAGGRFAPPVSQWQDEFLHRVFSPIFSFVSGSFQKISDLSRHYVFLTGAARENEALKSENAELLRKLAELEGVKNDYERQASSLKFTEKLPFKTEMARVIAYDPFKGGKSLLVDKGGEAGLKKGQPVITKEGVVGVVGSVTEQDARVLLITDPASAVDSEIRPSGARGIVQGQRQALGLNRDYWLTRMEYLGISNEIHEQDSVVTSGLDQVFPPGLSIGKVQKLKRDEKGLFLSAEVLPEVDFSKLKEVIVMIK
ncbi:MAG: rod shape-determining protein MreC [bacterium]